MIQPNRQIPYFNLYSYIIIIIGLILRFLDIHAELWRDQAFSARASTFTFPQLLNVVRQDTATPLHYISIFFWSRLVGRSQLLYRLPSILAGLASIIVFKNLLKKIFTDQKSILLALTLYAVSPQFRNYDQMARLYSYNSLFCIVIFSTMIDLIQKKDSLFDYVKLTIFTLLGLCNFNLFLFVGFANLVFLLYYLDNNRRFKVLICYFIAGIFYLPVFIHFTLNQLGFVHQSHLPFYLSVSLFIIFIPMFSSERGPSSASQLDMVVRISAFGISGVLVVLTALKWAKSHIKLTNKYAIFFSKYIILMLVMVYIYSATKTTVASPRYLLFITPLLFIIVVNLYSTKNVKILYIFIAFSLLVSIYQGTSGFIYKSDVKAMLKDIEYTNKTLLLVNDGATFHTVKYYSQNPVYIFDPDRKIKFYEGTAIFRKQDYYDGNFDNYDKIYVFYWRQLDKLLRKLQQEDFKFEFKRLYNSREYTLQKWVK